ncbi:hypothetical protein CRE_27619 [Caenorhabditis remanei]|uniref:Uncharacterized protein n=1 Tax=Caenorhabditis remanei TaxID=31234 RepID=E3MKJ2_CAERE|nr:hypothetical protein CRE_27619 [Caenorhabditis remanei]
MFLLILKAESEEISKRVSFNKIQHFSSIKFNITPVLYQAKNYNKSVQIVFFANTPIIYRLSKCGNSFLSTWDKVLQHEIFLQDEAIDWFLNISNASCRDNHSEMHQLHLDLLPSGPSSGAVMFKAFDRQTESSMYRNTTSFIINSGGNEHLTFKSVISDDFLAENTTVQIKSDLTSPVRVNFGKCGLILSDESFHLHKTDNIVLTGAVLSKIKSLAGIQCSSHNEETSFEFLVTTDNTTSGVVFFEIVKENESSDVEYVILAVFIVIFLLVIFCFVLKCSKHGSSKMLQKKIEDNRNRFPMAPILNRCDTCGSIHRLQ